MKGIFLVSNGYGEDSIAVGIVTALRNKAPETNVFVLPLVGSGKSYEQCDCTILGPRTAMPSGGVIPGNPANLAKDIRSGLLKLTLKQMKIMADYGKKSCVTVAIGDIYPALLATFTVPKPRIMVATAKSDYVSKHNLFEKTVMKLFFNHVFVRDEITAESLRKSGVSALWVGNAMMDCLTPEGKNFELSGDSFLIGIFPGSRQSAYLDMPYILDALEIINRDYNGKAVFAAAIAPSIDRAEFAGNFRSLGWSYFTDNESRSFMKRENIAVELLSGKVGDLLHSSRLIIGQAGTANEQAAGLGKPIVSFDSFEKNGMGWYRKRQKGLLGDAVSVIPKDSLKIASEVKKILSDKELYVKMAATGVERMGPPGGADKMADHILSFVPQE